MPRYSPGSAAKRCLEVFGFGQGRRARMRSLIVGKGFGGIGGLL